ncbi:MAG: hypothetical protein WA902_08915 [Thermosynechococcaceae cyanobacterium]
MRKKTRNILFIVSTIGVSTAIWLGIELSARFNNEMFARQQESAIQATLIWGGLAQISDNSQNVTIKILGGTFTRQFNLSFESTEAKINQWVQNSKRLRSQSPKTGKGNVLRDEVQSGEEGAIGGTVLIDRKNESVIIDMSWS